MLLLAASQQGFVGPPPLSLTPNSEGWRLLWRTQWMLVVATGLLAQGWLGVRRVQFVFQDELSPAAYAQARRQWGNRLADDG